MMSNPRATSGDSWDAATYERYSDERSRPFHELLARVRAIGPQTVVDLGCGTGAGLATMSHRWPQAQLIGVDSSADMLTAARAQLGDLAESGSASVIHADVQTWAPEMPVDIVVSNALLQWIPDQAALLKRMARWLTAGGWLAMQVPGNFDAPSHLLLRQLTSTPQWAERLGGTLRGSDSVSDVTGYFQILTDAGLIVDAWETTYLHVLTGPDPVLRWTSGTALRPVLAVLSDPEAAEFTDEYAGMLRRAYPADDGGRVLFPFRRIFAVGHR